MGYFTSAYKTITCIPGKYLISGSLATIKVFIFGKRRLTEETEQALTQTLSFLTSTVGLPT